MRTTQFLGLHPKAKSWIDTHCHPKGISTPRWVDGMFGEKYYQIQKYTLKTPKTIVKNQKTPNYLETHIEEYVQAQPWSSGPVIFLALRYSKCKKPVTQTLWPETDIQNC